MMNKMQTYASIRIHLYVHEIVFQMKSCNYIEQFVLECCTYVNVNKINEIMHCLAFWLNKYLFILNRNQKLYNAQTINQ